MITQVPARIQIRKPPKFKSVEEISKWLSENIKVEDNLYAVLAKGLNDFVNNPFIPQVATASLPVAGASMDGQMIIEKAAGPAINLIVYGNGLRIRIAGVVF